MKTPCEATEAMSSSLNCGAREIVTVSCGCHTGLVFSAICTVVQAFFVFRQSQERVDIRCGDRENHDGVKGMFTNCFWACGALLGRVAGMLALDEMRVLLLCMLRPHLHPHPQLHPRPRG